MKQNFESVPAVKPLTPCPSFLCACGHTVVADGVGTGYANLKGKTLCYACCAEVDKAQMISTGRTMLYLTHHADGKQHGNFANDCAPAKPVWTVSNWPGTLKISAYVTVGRHNMAGKRYDAWFTGPDGKQWHGVTYGDNTQICHCKRIKS